MEAIVSIVWYPSKKPLLKAWGYVSEFIYKSVANIPLIIININNIKSIGVNIFPTLSITLLALKEKSMTIAK